MSIEQTSTVSGHLRFAGWAWLRRGDHVIHHPSGSRVRMPSELVLRTRRRPLRASVVISVNRALVWGSPARR
jgi:hypothetical protein